VHVWTLHACSCRHFHKKIAQLTKRVLHVIAGSADKTCRVWNPQTTKCVLNLSEHGAAVTNVWCDEYQIISATADGRLRVWSYTGTCICILESDDYETLQEPQPMTMLVFQKPLAIAIHDSEGGITIFSRDTESESISPERRRSTQDWAPNKSARSPSRKTISRNMLTVHSRGKTSNPRASVSVCEHADSLL
jgi:WD40 repeat protein